MMDKRKMTIRIGKNTLSFTLLDVTSQEQPVIYEPYIVKGGISMAANLREALKTVNLSAADTHRVRVLLDTPSTLVPIDEFEEEEIEDLLNHVFPATQEPRTALFNVLPDLKAVCLFAVNKDLRGVICDQFADVQFIAICISAASLVIATSSMAISTASASTSLVSSRTASNSATRLRPLTPMTPSTSCYTPGSCFDWRQNTTSCTSWETSQNRSGS